MFESQIELDDERKRLYEKLCEMNPTMDEMVGSMLSRVYCEGVLGKKVKYLMALAIALGSGCRNCVLAQLTSALSNGATKVEIMEVLSVVYAMRGTTGTGEALRVVKYLEELEQQHA